MTATSSGAIRRSEQSRQSMNDRRRRCGGASKRRGRLLLAAIPLLAAASLLAPGAAVEVQAQATVTSARTIHMYVVEVAFNQDMRVTQQPTQSVSVTVNGRNHEVAGARFPCETSSHNSCRRPHRARSLWILLAQPIFVNDIVRFSYSRAGGARPIYDARGRAIAPISNYLVTNRVTQDKPTITLESIDSSVVETQSGATTKARARYRMRSADHGTLYPGTVRLQSDITGRQVDRDVHFGTSGPHVRVRASWDSTHLGASSGGTKRLINDFKSGQWYWDMVYIVPEGSSDHGPLTIELLAGNHYNVGTSSSVCIRVDASSTDAGTACSSQQVSAEPLTAEFTNLPTTHDGGAFDFQLELSEAVSTTAAQMLGAVSATNGSVTKASLADGSDTVWDLEVTPSGTETVTVSVSPSTSCTDAAAICTSDGRTLSLGLASMVLFAPSLSVADAEATEGENTSLDFVVTLAPAVSDAVTVAYATSDGTATAGQDYTATSGTLSFAANETTKTVSVPIAEDKVDDDGETVTLTLSGPTGAVLADAEATGTIGDAETTTRSASAALTASFDNVPASHDGATTFTFDLEFSEDVAGLGYSTVKEAFDVTGGDVERAKRKTADANQSWTIHVDPDGSGAVTITLPAGAITTSDSRSLESAVTATVAGPPTTALTATFENVPASHDAETTFAFDLEFSEDVAGLGYSTVKEAFNVTGGSVERAKRKTAGGNRSWAIDVDPDGSNAVTITLPAGAITTSDNRSLESAVTATVAGPIGITVADAEVDEGANAVLSFTVTLSRAAAAAMTVAYATSDGTALAGSDYTAASGTLSFAAGDSSKNIDVSVTDDAHDEGSETLTLTLSNPSIGVLTDDTATGTIKNHDPLPLALVARFGRTAAVHVVEQVEQRIEAPRGRGFDGRIAGRELRRGSEREVALSFLDQLAVLGGGTGAMHQVTGGAPGRASVAMGAGGPLQALSSPLGMMADRHEGLNGGGLLQTGLGGGVLTGSAFALNRETRNGGILSFWSRNAQSQFSGQDGTLSLGGGVRTAMFGADYAKGPVVTGVSLSHSRGLGEYAGTAGGEVASAVTGLYPWMGYKATERITLWGVAGYGSGGLLLTPEGSPALESGLSMAMAAAGTRGELIAGGADGFGLAFKTDALWVGTSIGGTEGPGGKLNAAEAAVTRFRTALEGSRAYTAAGRLSLTPSVEVGLRHDGGDAETGAGMDVGVGLILSDAATGLAVDVQIRTLVVHQAAGFSERGVAVSLSYNPTPSTPLGFTARVAPSWGGQATSGADGLWGRETMTGMAHGGLTTQGDRLDGEVGYGLPLGRRFVGTPRVGFSSSAYGRDYRVGYDLGVLERGNMNLEFGVNAHRRESPMFDGADNGLLGRATLGW